MHNFVVHSYRAPNKIMNCIAPVRKCAKLSLMHTIIDQNSPEYFINENTELKMLCISILYDMPFIVWHCSNPPNPIKMITVCLQLLTSVYQNLKYFF